MGGDACCVYCGRMTRRGVIATVMAAAVVVSALLVAALSDPVAVVSRPMIATTDTRTPTDVELPMGSSSPGVSSSTGDVGQSGLFTLFGTLLALLGVACLLVLVALLAAALRAIYNKPTLVVHREPTFELPPLPDDLVESAEARMRLLETGEPRNAIVAAWLDLESAAAGTGLPREPAETSTEYTARVIGTWDVDPARLDDLARLYREARFSQHELGEAHRRRAIDDLEVLHADLARASAAAARQALDEAAARAGADRAGDAS